MLTIKKAMSTVPDRETAARQSTRQRISRGLWRWCSSRGALLVLLLLLAATLALSYIYPQVSAYVRSDPMTYEEWLSTVQVHYRRWTPILRALGLFHVRDTLWFRALLALLLLVLLVSLADCADRLLAEQRVGHAESFYERDGIELSSDLPAGETAERIKGAWMGLGVTVRDRNEPGITYLCAQQRVWASTDTALTYLGALLLVVALAVNARWGWRQLGVQMYPNRPVYLGPQASHRIELIDASAGLGNAAIEIDGRGPLPISDGRGSGSMAYSYELADGGGPLVSVTAWGGNGDSLAVSEYALRPEEQSTLLLAFSAAPEDQTARLFILPEEKVVVRLEWLNPEETGTASPRFRQWVFEQGGQTLVGTSEIGASGRSATTEIGGVTYQWVVSSHAVLDVAYQPGRWILGTSAVLALSGLAMQLVPRRQAWAMVQKSEDSTAVHYRDHNAPGDVSLRRAVATALGTGIEDISW
jgi:hypothetical protein